MNERIGMYVPQTVAGESYKAYVPAKLPPKPPIDLGLLYPQLERATRAIAELNGINKSIPNTSLFLYMYVRKEALLSSQIEGTQSSLSDLMLFEHHLEPNVSIDDVQEVSDYVKAITYGLDRIKKGFPVSLRLLREVHKVLLAGSRGSSKSPGEFRRSQNWIGGSKPSNARFVPPPVDYLNQCLFDFEEFLHDDTLPVLIKAGLAHVQFETIHPFLDGNGRLGRLLITLLLCSEGVLNEPILYVSLHLKQHRQMYYDLLQAVQVDGAWEAWLEFFLEGVYISAQQAIQATHRINDLFTRDIERIATLGRARFSCNTVFEYVKRLPQITVSVLVSELKMTAPTARNALNNLVSLGVLEDVGNKKWGKVYVYRSYLTILEEGAQALQ